MDFGVLFIAELKASLEIPVGRPERALPRAGEILGTVHYVDGPLLKLDSVAASGSSYFNQSLGHLDAAVVIDAYFSHNKRRFTGTDRPVSNNDGFH
jgi:hypothetical protein